MSAPVVTPVADELTKPEGTEGATPEGAPADLGDAGKKAIDTMKAERNAERDKRKALEAELAELRKPKPADDAAPDLEAMRKQLRDEVAAEGMQDKALDRLEARAAKLFANPEDARTFLAGKVGDFVDGKKVDVTAIDEALADLLEKRPYLAVAQGDTSRFNGSGDGGPRGDAGKPQLTRAEVDRLAAQGKHKDIEAARKDGRLNKLLGIS